MRRITVIATRAPVAGVQRSGHVGAVCGARTLPKRRQGRGNDSCNIKKHCGAANVPKEMRLSTEHSAYSAPQFASIIVYRFCNVILPILLLCRHRRSGAQLLCHRMRQSHRGYGQIVAANTLADGTPDFGGVWR